MRAVLAVLVACLTVLLGATPSRGQTEIPRGFSPLFNGKDFTGWYGVPHFDPRQLTALPEGDRKTKLAEWMKETLAHWRVENGEIVNDGHGPYLTTEKEPGDFELLLDYKTVSLADSGIYLRWNPQVQIWDWTKAGGKWNRGADRGSGGLFNNAPRSPGQEPLALADKPFGQWNRFRIRQVGARTDVWLNDKLVVDHAIMENFWERAKPHVRRGPFQLQTHGGEIRWRNLFIREIGADEANRILRREEQELRSTRSTAKTSPAGKATWPATKSSTARSFASRRWAATCSRRTSTPTSSSGWSSSCRPAATTGWPSVIPAKGSRT